MEGNSSTAPESTVPPKAEKSNSGGKPSKDRRKKSRAAKYNVPKADAITNQAANRLGLKSTETFLGLSPAYSLRPTAVHVDLFACNVAITAMLTRMRAIAQRPLANLLADVGRVSSFRKVCTYLLFSRVCAAQLNVSYATGVLMDLMDVISAEQLRIIDARCILLPNFFSWMLSQIGCFEVDSQKVVPTMPNPAQELVTVQDALRGNYFSICHYVQRHRPGANGINIPAADEEFIPHLIAMLPVAVHNHRFTNAAVALFHEVVTGIQWDDFTVINGALHEQKCCTTDFKISEAVGTEAARVRFMTRLLNHEQVDFYCCDTVDNLIIKNALIVRLGMDVDLPAAMARSRFIMERGQAPLSGSDVPAGFLNAQLLMLSKLEAR